MIGASFSRFVGLRRGEGVREEKGEMGKGKIEMGSEEDGERGKRKMEGEEGRW